MRPSSMTFFFAGNARGRGRGGDRGGKAVEKVSIRKEKKGCGHSFLFDDLAWLNSSTKKRGGPEEDGETSEKKGIVGSLYFRLTRELKGKRRREKVRRDAKKKKGKWPKGVALPFFFSP